MFVKCEFVSLFCLEIFHWWESSLCCCCGDWECQNKTNQSIN